MTTAACTAADLCLPRRFRKMKSLPGDPPDSVPYAYSTQSMDSFLMIAPVGAEQAMPFTDPETVVEEIHRCLGEDQGLIEGRSGLTRGRKPFICSVVKTTRKHGVLYNLTLHLDMGGEVLQIQGFFDESGITGDRESEILLLMRQRGIVLETENGTEGWFMDPYDDTFTFGVPMNLSEQPQFDNLFPGHPLSELRKFLKEIISEN